MHIWKRRLGASDGFCISGWGEPRRSLFGDEGEMMSVPRCAWEGCIRAAAVDVLVGDLERRTRRHHGQYCVPHSVVTSQMLRSSGDDDVWFTVISPDRSAGM
jgi:hypothetical protein